MATVYIKAEQSCCLNHHNVIIQDIAKIYCRDKDIEHAVKKIKLLQFDKKENGREILSIMKLVELIQNENKDVVVENMGVNDFIIYYKPPGSGDSKTVLKIKILLVCMVAFFGSAFSVMTYNEDASVSKIFGALHELFMGTKPQGATVIDLMYCIGLALGVIVFFNHAAKKRLSDDPTPFEVQMRLYERDVNDTFIIGSERKEETIDVD